MANRQLPTNWLPVRALPHAPASYGICALSSLAPADAAPAVLDRRRPGPSKDLPSSCRLCMLSFVPTAWRAGCKSQRWGRSRILSYFVRLVTATRRPLPADVRHVSSPWVLHNAATPPRTRRVFYATSHRSILAQDRAGGGQAQAGRDRVASASPASPPRGHRDAYAAADDLVAPDLRPDPRRTQIFDLQSAARRQSTTGTDYELMQRIWGPEE